MCYPESQALMRTLRPLTAITPLEEGKTLQAFHQQAGLLQRLN